MMKKQKFHRDRRNRGDGYRLLETIRDGAARLTFFDPQYRSVLEKMKYGNEGARQRRRAQLTQMSNSTIAEFMREIERSTAPSGHVMLWVDKFLLVSSHWRRWLPPATALCEVDLIAWNKKTFGMGRRTRCTTEYLIILQKGPKRAAGAWTDHAILDSCDEKADRSRHAHAKPVGLITRLIWATTKRGQLVVDPAAGGYGVLEACRTTGRKFLGCDLI